MHNIEPHAQYPYVSFYKRLVKVSFLVYFFRNMVKRYHLISIALLISVIGSSDQGTKNVKRSLGFSQSNETEKSDTYDSAYVGKVEVNKKCFRNIYAPHGAKFRFIFSVEAKPIQSK